MWRRSTLAESPTRAVRSLPVPGLLPFRCSNTLRAVLTHGSKSFLEKLGRAVRDQMLRGKIRRGIHHTKHRDDALHLFQILEFMVKSCQQTDRCTASRQLSFFGGELNAQFPAQGFPSRLAMGPETYRTCPVRTVGTKAATAASATG